MRRATTGPAQPTDAVSPTQSDATDIDGEVAWAGGARDAVVSTIAASVIEGVRQALTLLDGQGVPMANLQEIVLGVQQGQLNVIRQLSEPT